MKIEKDTIELIKKICVFGFTLIITVIIPLALYLGYLNFGNEVFIGRIRIILMILIGFGSFISLLTLVNYLFNPISRLTLILSILTEILYSGYIIIWSEIGRVNIKTEEFLFSYDISRLILISLGIPLLLIIKITLNFIERSKRSIITALILKSIANNNFNSILKIRKFLNQNFSQKYKLKNYIDLIGELESKANPYMIKRDKYYLTQKGRKFLIWIEKHRINIINNYFHVNPEKQRVPLQVWTEEELKKFKGDD